MPNTEQQQRQAFEDAIRALETEVANIGTHLAIDSAARASYSRQIHAMSAELRVMASTGQLTWQQAAHQAHDARNVIMEIVRTRSTPVGRALAENMKRQGVTLNQIIAKKTVSMYGVGKSFEGLSAAEKNAVYAEIVASAGKSRPEVTAMMQRLSHAGRGLIFVSLGISVYTVATADDKLQAASREAALTGAGVGGGIAGGALAGLACGPGAPVCVTLGAFIGGGLAAFGVATFW